MNANKRTDDSQIAVTADNQQILFKDVTHQHWSNIFWYNLIFSELSGMPKSKMINNCQIAVENINKRFDKKILDWKPVYKFELNWLKERNWVNDKNEIIHNGDKIGEIDIDSLREVEGIN